MNSPQSPRPESGGERTIRSDDRPSQRRYSPADIVGQPLTTEKGAEITRMYFININGIQFGPDGGDFHEVLQEMKTARIDVLGIAEHKLDTTLSHVRETCHRVVRQKFRHARLYLASSNRSYGSTYKPGGTAILTQGPTVGRIRGGGNDPMGRWSYTTFSGKAGKLISVIFVYQVGKDKPTIDTQIHHKTKKYSAGTQQYSMMREQGRPPDRHPRIQFRIDLNKFVKDLRANHHDIIIAGDFNEELGEDPQGVAKIASQNCLVDLMKLKLGTTEFGTHINGRHRIDYVLASPKMLLACRGVGYESILNGRFGSDHRGIFMDFDTKALFGNTTPPLATPPGRILNTKNRKACETYITAKNKYLEDHNWFHRLTSMMETEELNGITAEKIDRDWVRAALHAEKSLSRLPTPPFSDQLTRLRKLKSSMRYIIKCKRWDYRVDDQVIRFLEIHGWNVPQSLTECQRMYEQIKKQVIEKEKQAVNLRKEEQESRYQQLLARGERIAATAVRNIRIAEELREMYKKLNALSRTSDTTISSILVPSSGDLTNESCRTCEEWSVVDQPEEIQRVLIQRNQLHFGQAHGTFPTVPPFSNYVDWSAITLESQMLLNGEDPSFMADIDETSSCLLNHVKRTTTPDAIPGTITTEEWESKMRTWNESTTTSPSGVHLGHYKALTVHLPAPEDGRDGDSDEINQPSPSELQAKLLKAQVDVINYAITRNYSFQRWKKVVTAMILKEPGNRKINRLRVIHLYEADFNALLGVKWRALTHHAVDNTLFNEWQFGGRPGNDALTPAFLEELQWEITRASRRSLIRQDFDATSCYDRIIMSIASLAGKSFGQHSDVCTLQADTLKGARYYLKTALGVSDDYFSHTKSAPIYGTGQGSTSSPSIWLCLSSRLFDAHASLAHGAKFLSPDRSFSIEVNMIGFVDDTYNTVNDFEGTQQDLPTILSRARKDAQLWNDLLYVSGGALEVSKCKVHVGHYVFARDGAPVLDPLGPVDVAINVQESGTGGTNIPLMYVPPSTARKTLGCFKSPAGHFKKSLLAISENVAAKVTVVLNSSLDPTSVWRYYKSIFIPSVTYSFAVNAIPENQLKRLQTCMSRGFLNKMGYAITTPHPVVFGPRRYGGIGMPQFFDIQGASQTELFIKHWRTPSGTNQHLRIAIAWAQRLSGLATPILQEPSLELPHLELVWIQSLRTYLGKVGAKIEIEEELSAPLQREGDEHILEHVVRSNMFTATEIRWVSYCAHYLQVQTLSDVVLADGLVIDPGFWSGKTSLLSSISTDLHPHQNKPESAKVWNTWRKALRLWCTRDAVLRRPLGRWLVPSTKLRRIWPYHINSRTSRLYVRSSEGYDVHRAINRGTRFNSFQYTRVQELPKSCTPVQCCERPTQPPFQITVRCHPGLVQRQSPSRSPRTFEHYMNTVPLWEQQLTNNVQMELPLETVTRLMQEEQTISVPQEGGCWAAADGSVRSNTGTFGWAVGLKNGTILLRGKGRVFGAPINSYRAEGFGLLSMLVYIRRLFHFQTQSNPPQIRMVSDNQALVHELQKIRSRTRPAFPNDSLRPSWDVLQAILTVWSDFPESSLEHVRGHQDRDQNRRELDIPAQLNCEADDLASAAYQLDPCPESSCQMLGGTRCQLIVNQSAISSHIRNSIMDIRSTQALKQRIQKQMRVTNAVFDEVDWEAHELAGVNCRDVPDVFVTKFLHRILPVGRRLVQYDKERYSGRCPSCDSEVEDQDHLFKCTHEQRTRWRQALKTEIHGFSNRTDMSEGVKDVFLSGLFSWIEEVEFPSHQFHGSLGALAESQARIGWDQILYGRLSTQWAGAQSISLDRRGIDANQKNSGSAWVSSLIRVIWKQCHAVWIERNEAKHGCDAETSRVAKLAALQLRLKSLYRLKADVLPSDRNKFFYNSVEEHIEREPTVKAQTDWVTVYEPMILRSVKTRALTKRNGLRTIDDMFEVIS